MDELRNSDNLTELTRQLKESNDKNGGLEVKITELNEEVAKIQSQTPQNGESDEHINQLLVQNAKLFEEVNKLQKQLERGDNCSLYSNSMLNDSMASRGFDMCDTPKRRSYRLT